MVKRKRRKEFYGYQVSKGLAGPASRCLEALVQRRTALRSRGRHQRLPVDADHLTTLRGTDEKSLGKVSAETADSRNRF